MNFPVSVPGSRLDQVAAKRAEIADYERVLNNYRGRWRHTGVDHLAELKKELEELESKVEQGS